MSFLGLFRPPLLGLAFSASLMPQLLLGLAGAEIAVVGGGRDGLGGGAIGTTLIPRRDVPIPEGVTVTEIVLQ